MHGRTHEIATTENLTADTLNYCQGHSSCDLQSRLMYFGFFIYGVKDKLAAAELDHNPLKKCHDT